MNNLPKEPFRRYKLDEEKELEEDKTFTIRVNSREMAMIDELKSILDIKSNGTALKFGAEIGLNVLHSTFSDKMLKYLFKKNRKRLVDFD